MRHPDPQVGARPPGAARTTSRAAAALLVTSLLAAGAAPLAAQASPDPDYSRFGGGIGLLNTQPVGALATGPGFGLAVNGAFAVDAGQVFRLRADLRAAGYGSESRTVCLSETVGCLIEVDLTTSYSNIYFGVGPELAIPMGPVTLALGATAGFGVFSVDTSLRDPDDPDDEELLTTNNFSDEFLAWAAGGEVRVRVSPNLAVSVGGHYQHNGRASYVPEGGVTQNEDGTLRIDAVTSDANQVAITLGVAVRPFVGWLDEATEPN